MPGEKPLGAKERNKNNKLNPHMATMPGFELGPHWWLPACRSLIFPLLHTEKGCLRNAVANHVPASCWVPKILGTRCDRLTHSAHCLT